MGKYRYINGKSLKTCSVTLRLRSEGCPNVTSAEDAAGSADKDSEVAEDALLPTTEREEAAEALDGCFELIAAAAASTVAAIEAAFEAVDIEGLALSLPEVAVDVNLGFILRNISDVGAVKILELISTLLLHSAPEVVTATDWEAFVRVWRAPLTIACERRGKLGVSRFMVEDGIMFGDDCC